MCVYIYIQGEIDSEKGGERERENKKDLIQGFELFGPELSLFKRRLPRPLPLLAERPMWSKRQLG